MMRARVLLADHNPQMLEALGNLLENDCEVVGKVGDGQALIEAAQRLLPDIVVEDISLPLVNSLEAARRMRTLVPTAKIIFLSLQADPWYVQEGFKAGASAFLLKRSAAVELLAAIRVVLQGKVYLTPLMQEKDNEGFLRGQKPVVPPTITPPFSRKA